MGCGFLVVARCRLSLADFLKIRVFYLQLLYSSMLEIHSCLVLDDCRVVCSILQVSVRTPGKCKTIGDADYSSLNGLLAYEYWLRCLQGVASRNAKNKW